MTEPRTNSAHIHTQGNFLVSKKFTVGVMTEKTVESWEKWTLKVPSIFGFWRIHLMNETFGQRFFGKIYKNCEGLQVHNEKK